MWRSSGRHPLIMLIDCLSINTNIRRIQWIGGPIILYSFTAMSKEKHTNQEKQENRYSLANVNINVNLRVKPPLHSPRNNTNLQRIQCIGCSTLAIVRIYSQRCATPSTWIKRIGRIIILLPTPTSMSTCAHYQPKYMQTTPPFSTQQWSHNPNKSAVISINKLHHQHASSYWEIECLQQGWVPAPY